MNSLRSYFSEYIESTHKIEKLSMDEEDYKEKGSLNKLGLKIITYKFPIDMTEYLETDYKELSERMKTLFNQIESYVMINNMLAVRIPFRNAPMNEGLIFWFKPSLELLEYLPERYTEDLRKEFNLLEESAICGADIDKEKAYLDIWRSCSGDIQNLKIFPNPVKNTLNIKFYLAEKKEISYAIHDLQGNKIMDLDYPVKAETGDISRSFDLSSLKTNMYLLVVNSSDGEQAVQRMIKE